MDLHIILSDVNIEHLARRYYRKDHVLADYDPLDVGPLVHEMTSFRLQREVFHQNFYHFVLPTPELWTERFPGLLDCIERVCIWLTSSPSDHVALALWVTRLESLGFPAGQVDVVSGGSIQHALRSAHLSAESPPEWIRLRRVLDPAEWSRLQRWWEALTSPTPTEFLRLLEQPFEGLPNRESLWSMLGRYPDGATGLTVLEDLLLRQIARRQGVGVKGAVVVSECLSSASGLFDQPGDRTLGEFLLRLDQVASSAPLVHSLGRENGFRAEFVLTDLGRAVLARQTNYLEIRVIDWWVGGVHLSSADNSVWVRVDDDLVPWP